MTPEQALLILVNAAHQAKLSYSDHIAIEQAKVMLAESLGLGEQPEAEDGEKEEQVS